MENLVLIDTGGGVLATVPVAVDTGFFGFVISPIEGLSKITFQSQLGNPDPSVGQGFGLENVNGAYASAPTPVPPTEIATTVSSLVYSRATRTFNGTVTIKNISGDIINGPFQIVFASLTPVVTLVNAMGNFAGSPYLPVPSVMSLAPGDKATVAVTFRFRGPSRRHIRFTPVIYAWSLN